VTEDAFGKISNSGGAPLKAAPGLWMIPGFGNTGVVETEEGLVLVDVPVGALATGMIARLREISDAPVHTLFITHGHLDHAFFDPLVREARQRGFNPPRVVAQRDVEKRLNKYRMLHGYHEYINRVQFAVPEGVPAFPYPTRDPDILFDKTLSTRIGGLDFHAYHQLGETDDASWVWLPEKQTVFAGDLVVWSFPNVGNPFKVQRYTLEWAEGLEAILAKEPEVLVPGHGPLIQGRQAIREKLLKISDALRYLHREVVDRLNRGVWYEDILHQVALPPEMLDDDFLAPRYGCPTFVVHGILRQYTGWYDGNPSNLFPPKRSEVAAEIAALAGKDRIMDRAGALKDAGREAMALQFVDLALAADLTETEARDMHRLKAELLDVLGNRDTSLIARSIYFNGKKEELKRAGP